MERQSELPKLIKQGWNPLFRLRYYQNMISWTSVSVKWISVFLCTPCAETVCCAGADWEVTGNQKSGWLRISRSNRKKQGQGSPNTFNIPKVDLFVNKKLCKRDKIYTWHKFNKKVWAGSHLAKPHPECYIIIRKGDTNVQVKPKLFREREQRGIYEREVKMMLDTKSFENWPLTVGCKDS